MMLLQAEHYEGSLGVYERYRGGTPEIFGVSRLL
jgi:hypothetical protein